MKLYISGGAVCLLLLFYLPWVLYFLRRLWREFSDRLPIRIAALTVASVLAAAIPLWDVVMTSVKMAELCPQAGVKIHRTVTADGFYTTFGGPDDLKRGFKYVEAKSGILVTIYTKAGDEIQKQVIDTEKTPYVPKSRYEFIYDAEHGAFNGRRDIGIQKSIARDRETKEELGYALRYKAYPGWVDRITLALIGQILWMCPGDQDQNVKFKHQVILPN